MTLSQEQHTSFLSPTSPKPTAKPAPSPPSSLPSSPRNVISQPPSTLTSHFVQALHDYLPTNAPADDAVSCLFFRKGDIIEVFNRDSSGWWDGSSGGVRGWFPSNYVGRIGDAVRDGDFEDQKELEVWQRKRQANNENLNNNNTTATTESTTTVSRTNVSEVTTTTPVNRVELARALLNEDRRKSNPRATNDVSPSYVPVWDNLMEDVSRRMSELAHACASCSNLQMPVFHVVTSIRAVLTAANIVSNDSPLLKTFPELARQRKIILSTLSKLVLKGKEMQGGEDSSADENDYVRGLVNKLLTDMEAFEDTLSSTIPGFQRLKAPLLPDKDPTATDMRSSNNQISPRSSVVSLESSASSFLLRQQLVESRLSSASLIAKAVPLADAQNILQTLLEHQATIDELMAGLVSTIERFLSSNRQRATEMLEMTRRGVEATRTFLAVVEHVCSNVGELDYKHCSVIPEDPHLVALVLAKESVYSAITNLVTAIRALAGHRDSGDMTHLKESCENVVKTTNECATRVRICLQVDQQQSQAAEEDVQEMRGRLENSIDTRRNQTLSILGRKATSLNVLQHQYDNDEQQHTDKENSIMEEEENTNKEEEEEERASAAKTTTAPLRTTSNLARSDNVRRPRLSSSSTTSSSLRTSSSSSTTLKRSIRSSVESVSSSHMASAEAMSPISELPAQSLTAECPRTPLPPKSVSQQDLKLLSSKSTPTNDASKRGRRPRELSMSGFRMSVKHRNNNDEGSEGALSKVRRSPSWLSVSDTERREGPQVSAELKKENEPWFLKQRTFSEDEVMVNSDGQVMGASVEALVENLTLHEKSPDLIFTRAFFYNFRLFTTPTVFVELLVKRFSLQPPPELNEEELALWTEKVLVPVRLRVYNVTKTWLESYFCYEQDASTEKQLIDFATGPMAQAMPAPAKRLTELIRKRFTSKGLKTTGRKMSFTNDVKGSTKQPSSGSHISLTSGSSLLSSLAIFEDHSENTVSAAPAPNVARSLRSNLRKAMSQGALTSIPISEFDPQELARQLTLMESSLFCQIQPSEMIGQEFKKKVGSSRAVHVKAMIQRSTQITSLVSDTILRESDIKKRAQMIKFWIKIGDHCLQLSNYNTLMAIRSALDSTSIARLKRTWEYVSPKYKAMYDPIYKATDSQRNFAEYRRRLKNAVAPCLPFLGVYLTDMTFIDDGNSNYRTSPNGCQLINFDKYIKTTRILNEIDQFQIPYKLTEVEEIQRYLLQCLESVEKDDQVFYTRSLKLEPRQEEFDIGSFMSNLA